MIPNKVSGVLEVIAVPLIDTTWEVLDVSTNKPAKTQIGESLIEVTNCEKLLGVKIDSKLSFDKHIKTICKKANNKLRALKSCS